MQRLTLADFISNKPSVVTLGNFDGVHLGHQALLRELKQCSDQRDLTSVVVTFKPHPRLALRPDQDLKLIQTYEERAHKIEKWNVDVLIEEPFGPLFYELLPEEFIRKVLVEKLNTKVLIIGHDFKFGKNRQGDFEVLEFFSERYGYEVRQVPGVVTPRALTVSSSMIRELLSQAEIGPANECLGEGGFYYHGHVIRGDQRGRLLGFPTANLEIPEHKIQLPKGVYQTRTKVEWRTQKGLGSEQFDSITNIGTRPTFTQGEVLVETHLFADRPLDLYGETILVSFDHFIRAEKKFASLDELKEQIQKDIRSCR